MIPLDPHKAPSGHSWGRGVCDLTPRPTHIGGGGAQPWVHAVGRRGPQRELGATSAGLQSGPWLSLPSCFQPVVPVTLESWSGRSPFKNLSGNTSSAGGLGALPVKVQVRPPADASRNRPAVPGRAAQTRSRPPTVDARPAIPDTDGPSIDAQPRPPLQAADWKGCG